MKGLERLDGPSFRPGNKEYPAELAAAGVQGEVLVVVPLTADGRSNGASLGASSRSENLDRIALELTRAASFQVKEAPAKGWKAIVVSVGFYKDSATNLKLKTCADFNTDDAYQVVMFPERKPEEMRIFRLLSGVLHVGLGGKPEQVVDMARRAAAARQPTIDGCAARPESLFFDTWQAALKAAR